LKTIPTSATSYVITCRLPDLMSAFVLLATKCCHKRASSRLFSFSWTSWFPDTAAVRFAEQVAAGDLSARIAVTSGDEIAQVAMALDRTARRLEENFAAVCESRSELEALLNSMTDGVIAVSPDMKVRLGQPRHRRHTAPAGPHWCSNDRIAAPA
jgi:hypothetical protein